MTCDTCKQTRSNMAIFLCNEREPLLSKTNCLYLSIQSYLRYIVSSAIRSYIRDTSPAIYTRLSYLFSPVASKLNLPCPTSPSGVDLVQPHKTRNPFVLKPYTANKRKLSLSLSISRLADWSKCRQPDLIIRRGRLGRNNCVIDWKHHREKRPFTHGTGLLASQ